MAYIGRPLQVANLAVQSGTGDGSDTTPIATLDYATTTNGIAVYLDGVRQLAGTDFNVTAQTTLTFTTAPANGVGIDVYFLGLELSLPTPADATVTTAKIAANAVDETKLKDALVADFTEVVVTASDSILLGDATDSGNTKRDTVQGILDLVPSGITQGTTVATTTGNSITFGSIPAGVKRIVIILSSVSTASTSPMVIRLGDAGGIETNDYLGAVTNGTTNYTYGTGSGIALQTVSSAAGLYHFTILLSLLDADTFLWNASHTGAVSDTYNGAGTKALSAELTQVQLTTVAGNQAFDSGKMNIQYE
jgi:hypothetical protein